MQLFWAPGTRRQVGTQGLGKPDTTRRVEDTVTRGWGVEVKLSLYPVAGVSGQRVKTELCSGKQLTEAQRSEAGISWAVKVGNT